QKAILRTLAYYDVFRFPLKEDELISFGSFGGHKEDLQRELCALTKSGIIGELRGYYFLADFSPAHVEAREVNEIRAAAAVKKVKRFSNLIARFPFVKCVCISGSYSKGVLDRYGDVDYFIIANPGRLWLARTMLILFKKIFLLNSRRYFCINYLIDSQSSKFRIKIFSQQLKYSRSCQWPEAIHTNSLPHKINGQNHSSQIVILRIQITSDLLLKKELSQNSFSMF
ncbi:MAG: hypothetical protein ACRC3B_11620, partial [Bacteroidia bacterium]